MQILYEATIVTRWVSLSGLAKMFEIIPGYLPYQNRGPKTKLEVKKAVRNFGKLDAFLSVGGLNIEGNKLGNKIFELFH
jgi:hypothetical protein